MEENKRKFKLTIAAFFVASFEFMMIVMIFNNDSAYSVATSVGQRTFWDSVIIAAILSALSLWGMIDEIKAR